MTEQDRYNSLFEWFFLKAATRFTFDGTVDWRLVRCQAIRESSLNPEAVGLAGERGLMQIMPGTWGKGFERDAFNPEKNIVKGTEHLGFLWAMFKAEAGQERWRFALAAYNAGPGHIITAQKRAAEQGLPTDQWATVASMLPLVTGPQNAMTTRSYVAHIMADYERLLA